MIRSRADNISVLDSDDSRVAKAIERIKKANTTATVDLVVQSLLQSGDEQLLCDEAHRRFGHALLHDSEDTAAIYILLAMLSLFGHVEAGQQRMLLIVTPEIESTVTSNYGKLQLLLTAFRSGLLSEAETAMVSMLDFREGSDQSHLLSLWTYGCVLGALKMDVEDYWGEQGLAYDGMRIAVMLEDSAKYERNWFSFANSSSFVSSDLQPPDYFSRIREYREQGTSSLNFVMLQLALLYSARDACALGDLKAADSYLHQVFEEYADFPPLVKAFYIAERARLALLKKQQKQASLLLLEADDHLQEYPNTLSFRVVEQVSKGLEKPLELQAVHNVHSANSREYKRAIARLTSAYKRCWRSALSQNLVV